MEEHADVLYPLELQMVQIGTDDPTLTDLHVEEAVRQLVRRYADLAAGGEANRRLPPRTDARATNLFTTLVASCDWLIRRSPEPPEAWPVSPNWKAAAVGDVVAALKRLHKSIKLWNEMGGRRGYIEYIQMNLPRG